MDEMICCLQDKGEKEGSAQLGTAIENYAAERTSMGKHEHSVLSTT
jgi:hypothetical protein